MAGNNGGKRIRRPSLEIVDIKIEQLREKNEKLTVALKQAEETYNEKKSALARNEKEMKDALARKTKLQADAQRREQLKAERAARVKLSPEERLEQRKAALAKARAARAAKRSEQNRNQDKQRREMAAFEKLQKKLAEKGMSIDEMLKQMDK